MSYEFAPFTPQGWQCPICHRVYSPTTPMCWYCGDKTTNMQTTTTSPSVSEVIEKAYEVIDTCPKCGHDLLDISITTYPPIPCKVCPNCGWSYEYGKSEIVRREFRKGKKDDE